MNDREKYKEELRESLSVSMYNMIDRRESLDRVKRGALTSDYNLLQIRREVLQRTSLPSGVRVDLRGYEIILINPTPVYIRFGIGNYWIGSHLFVIRNLEQIVDMMVYTISDVIPCSMAAYKKQSLDFEKEFQAPIDYFAKGQYDGLVMITDGYAPVPTLPDNTTGRILWMIYNDELFRKGDSQTLDENLTWIASFPRSKYVILPPV